MSYTALGDVVEVGCPPGHEYSVMAQGCVCPPGYEDDPDGECVPMNPGCPPGQHWSWDRARCEADWAATTPPAPPGPKPAVPSAWAWIFGGVVAGGAILLVWRSS